MPTTIRRRGLSKNPNNEKNSQWIVLVYTGKESEKQTYISLHAENDSVIKQFIRNREMDLEVQI